MELKDVARRFPDEIWAVFEPLLSPVVWVGNGRKPCKNCECLHGILYVLVNALTGQNIHQKKGRRNRGLPSARGDGAYGNEPTRQRTACSGFRMRAPRRGQTKLPGIGRIRSAVERGHAFLSQFGRIARRLDRIALRYLGWVQLAACVIFIRAGFFR